MYNEHETIDQTASIESRRMRGLELAALVKIESFGGGYLVPSINAPRPTKYLVDLTKGNCNCSDFEVSGLKCKHVYAVEYYLIREKSGATVPIIAEDIAVVKPRKTYPQNWTAYNAAQCNEKGEFQRLLADLCKNLVSPKEIGPCVGRPTVPLRDLLFSAVFKVYSTFSGRRFTSDLCDAQVKGFINKVPHYNTVFRCLENPEMFPVLTDLIRQTSLPLKSVETKFAVDSTGFAYSRFVRWYSIKYQRLASEKQWVKAHICAGVQTNVVTSIEIHGRNAHDAPIMPSLIQSTAKDFSVREILADKGYSSRANLKAIEAIGADPYVMFKSNSTGGVGGIFEKAWHFFSCHRDAFLKHYHQRSNVESTMMMIKTKFGDAVRSRSEVAAKNEVLCKVLYHNICCLISAMYELGINPEFN